MASLAEAYAVADQIGYPVMLKAAAGGGGKGMRAVAGREDMEAPSRRRRAKPSGPSDPDEVYLEKLIERPRHIEIQVLADEHGNCIYLGERECSVQRRHQKVIEEAPSAVVDSSCCGNAWAKPPCVWRSRQGYTNAGTVEFLLDDQEEFLFS